MYAINKMLVNFDEKYTDDLRQKVVDSGYSIREIARILVLPAATVGTRLSRGRALLKRELKAVSYES